VHTARLDQPLQVLEHGHVPLGGVPTGQRERRRLLHGHHASIRPLVSLVRGRRVRIGRMRSFHDAERHRVSPGQSLHRRFLHQRRLPHVDLAGPNMLHTLRVR
jgi:hypothetical protein